MTDPTPKKRRSRQLQGILAAEHRHPPAEAHTALRREHPAAQLEEYIERIVGEAPGLEPSQREKLARLLAGGTHASEPTSISA